MISIKLTYTYGPSNSFAEDRNRVDMATYGRGDLTKSCSDHK